MAERVRQEVNDAARFPALYETDDEDATKNQMKTLLSKFVSPLVFKTNMTANLTAETLEKLARNALALSPDRVQQECQNIASLVEQEVRLFFWKNFVGEIIVAKGLPDFSTYLPRFYDADAHLRLLRAQLEYWLAREGKDQPETLLQNLGPETFNSYTGKPFDWNVQEGTLTFVPVVALPQLPASGFVVKLH